ncbi:CRISPR-associated endoribonuclease Cas6 [Candidatus Bathyarchaeota archaeon]|nr:CRISPR-associated endoribonuclease Cas6 [Candidatus Bathyarchaeota archaeon]MBS7627371.1 CRISPR-associated endoribonuclease Cas6 [Candidatus Bathyarchaeota archaeon]
MDERTPYDRINKHGIQGFLYSFLRGTDYEDYHDKGSFKFFTFSDIFPLGDFEPNKVKSLLVSSPDDDFILTLRDSIHSRDGQGILEGHNIYILNCKVIRAQVSGRFISASPIVLYENSRNNLYYSFNRNKSLSFFLERLKENAMKKYKAYYEEDLNLEGNIFDKLVFRKEVAVRLSKEGRTFIVIGSVWRLLEKFKISKDEEKFYGFIMDCGLGEKNSLGFGFINPLR